MARLFPGIDPYIESQHYWRDFHVRFMTHCCEALADRLPDHYDARLDEFVNLVNATDERESLFSPDVAVVEVGPRPDAAGASMAVALASEPVTIPVTYLDEETEAYIKILNRKDRSLVAVVDVLSPSNKGGTGRQAYLIKRNALLIEPVHLVELDFLVEGRRLPMDRPLPRGDYFAIVANAGRRPDADVYAWSVRQPLPTIRVPLLAPDPDVLLELGAVVASAYDRGRYGRSIDYKAPLTVPLREDDRAWAEGLARASRSL